MNDHFIGYLQHVDDQLRRLPGGARAAEQQELAVHLEELYASYRAAGLDDATAAERTLEQFGPPSALGRALRHSWMERMRRLLLRQLLAYMICGATVFLFLLTTMDQPGDIALSTGAKLAWSLLVPLPSLTIFWVRRRQLR